MPTRIAPDGIGTKRPASRDLSGGAVRQTNHLRGIERPLRQTTAVSTCSRGPSLATLRGDHARAMESEQIFSLRCHAEQAEGLSPPQSFFLANDFILSTPGHGGAGRDRTDDILLAKQALSQLSYGP
jgi:hypothetical protein